MKLLQLDAAEEAFSQSLRIYTAIYPQGHDKISKRETTVETSFVVNDHLSCCSPVEQLQHVILQLKFGQW